MRAAAIDVGSNTLRMLVGEIQGDTLNRIYSDRKITRLAEGLGISGILGKNNMKESLSALKDFSLAIKGYGVSRVHAVGTSALRQARNSREFIDTVFLDTGVRIRVISGIEEAELTAKGIQLGFGRADAPLFIIDIGGGSTEWIIFDPEQSRPASCGSLPLGVVDLFERFVKTDPVSSGDMDAPNAEIDSHLSGLNDQAGHLPSGARFVGTGGTVTTLAALDLGLETYAPEKIHMHKISIERLEDLRELLFPMPLSRRQELKGLEPGRADLIIPGILLTIKFMDFFGFREITVSDYGLLEGLLMETKE